MQEYTVRVYGNVEDWYQNGQLHRLDGPATKYKNGDKYWYQNGKLHRTDGPAVECANGDKEYWQNGELHRVDGPAVVYADGYKEYWEKGFRMPDPNNVKEMTVAEISTKLGHNVKVVK